MGRLNAVLVVVALLSSALLGACGESAPAVTAVTLPAGWQRVEQSGVIFALPPGWEVVSGDQGAFESAMGDVVRENPGLADQVDSWRTLVEQDQIKLIAFDLAPEDTLPNYTTNLSIGQQELDAQVSLQQVAEANEQQLQASGFDDVRRAVLKIGPHDVVRLTSTLRINDAAGEPLDLALDQFILLRAQQQYVLTFTTTPDQMEKMAPRFEQIVSTFQVASD